MEPSLISKQRNMAIFLNWKVKSCFFPLINSSSPNRLKRIERLENLLAKMEKKKEVLRIDENIEQGKFEREIANLKSKFLECCSEDPNAFWHIHKHEVEFPLKNDFSGKLRILKAIPMNQE